MYDLFGTVHILAIIGSVIVTLILTFIFGKLKMEKVFKVMLYIGIISEVIKVFAFIIANEDKYGGYLPKTDLPLHLCSIQILFILFLNFSNNEKIKKLLLSFMLPSCLLGGIAAIFIATSSSRSMPVITLQYFTYHSALIAFSINLYRNKEIKFEFKDYINCLKFLMAIGFFAIYINSMLYDGTVNVNFMYVVDPPQSGLPFLNENNGWLVYICHYAFLAVTLISVCYIKQIIDKVKSLKKVRN